MPGLTACDLVGLETDLSPQQRQEAFCFTIQHWQGFAHGNADALSRLHGLWTYAATSWNLDLRRGVCGAGIGGHTAARTGEVCTGYQHHGQQSDPKATRQRK
ncbi:hypothetical protein SKAU_G00209370 [Synaphobranchus kaupii]|uniref:Uncharacterized protein n=1 Tax=Synaphobranchus kaupii TaxID=118154 RepID=A0A9Q1ISR2_SYNKA|nr:hypothetical protein SKAU_G00209370 [Synaphobranchus kaupii]